MNEHTHKQFDAEMEAIRSGVLAMGGLVETQLARAIGVLDDAADESVIELVEDATRRQYRDPAAYRELVRWMRFSRRDALSTRDGLSADALGRPYLPRPVGELAMRLFASPEREASRVARRVRTASALAVFATERGGPTGWMMLGRDFRRMEQEMPDVAQQIREAIELRLGRRPDS